MALSDLLRERSLQAKKAAPAAPVSALADQLASKVVEKKSPKSIPEITRITALPVIYPLTDEEIQGVQLQHVKAEALETGFRLQRVQAEALQAYVEFGTLFGPIEVGSGKTLISLRIVGMAHESGMRKTMLCVPPQVFAQLTQRDIAWARARVPIGCQFIPLGGKSRADRMSLASGYSRGCFIVPYSLLSTADTSELLEMIAPQLIVFDEAHNLKNRKAARTRRVMHYIRKAKPKVVALSGTMTSKSIMDYAHVLQMCLGAGSPLPLDAQVVAEWGNVLDADPRTDFMPVRGAGTGPLRPLVSWSNKLFPHDKLDYNVEGFRRAYQNRLLTTPGVVSSPADSLGCSLVISNTKVCIDGDGSEELLQHMRNVEEKWVAPNGDQIEWAIHKFKWNYELSHGFFNNLVWPTEEKLAHRWGSAAQEVLARAQEHHAQLQAYHKELRDWLKYHQIEGLDTPMLIGNDMARHSEKNVGSNLYKAWRAAKDLEFDNMPERESIPVRVCDYKIRAAVKWARERQGGIIWYLHHGIGEWLMEALKAACVPAIHCPAGNVANRFLNSEEAIERSKTHFLVCSLTAHSTGKNLQFVNDQLYLQFPRPEETAQQSIGRTHRKGQQADEVLVQTLISTQIDEISLSATLNDAVYVFETTSSRRKLLFANWNPMPVIYGQEALNRAGAEAKQLNIRQRKILEEQFGKPVG